MDRHGDPLPRTHADEQSAATLLLAIWHRMPDAGNERVTSRNSNKNAPYHQPPKKNAERPRSSPLLVLDTVQALTYGWAEAR